MARKQFSALLKCPKCGASGQATYSELDLHYGGDCNTRLVTLPTGFSESKEDQDKICCENCFEIFIPK